MTPYPSIAYDLPCNLPHPDSEVRPYECYTPGTLYRIDFGPPLPDDRDIGPEGQRGWRLEWTLWAIDPGTEEVLGSSSLGCAYDTGCVEITAYCDYDCQHGHDRALPSAVRRWLDRIFDRLCEAQVM